MKSRLTLQREIASLKKQLSVSDEKIKRIEEAYDAAANHVSEQMREIWAFETDTQKMQEALEWYAKSNSPTWNFKAREVLAELEALKA